MGQNPRANPTSLVYDGDTHALVAFVADLNRVMGISVPLTFSPAHRAPRERPTPRFARCVRVRAGRAKSDPQWNSWSRAAGKDPNEGARRCADDS